jgi:hypothetical protein
MWILHSTYGTVHVHNPQDGVYGTELISNGLVSISVETLNGTPSIRVVTPAGFWIGLKFFLNSRKSDR